MTPMATPHAATLRSAAADYLEALSGIAAGEAPATTTLVANARAAMAVRAVMAGREAAAISEATHRFLAGLRGAFRTASQGDEPAALASMVEVLASISDLTKEPDNATQH